MPRYCFPRARAICHGIVSPGRGPYAAVLFPPGEGHMPRYCFPRARAICRGIVSPGRGPYELRVPPYISENWTIIHNS
ncbi:hypothetical protein LOK49_LG02G02179 [Camellia lanceoleosa]|uniref:Uncharacterized protein n=1 Tax=Camellia lanceoleosa TaxID=1840588 RepID=A0ACC0IJ78_9ERIC|nr:hypothetical protein LOK49_LG02G02179 [Camellia lanceoleosa]